MLHHKKYRQTSALLFSTLTLEISPTVSDLALLLYRSRLNFALHLHEVSLCYVRLSERFQKVIYWEKIRKPMVSNISQCANNTNWDGNISRTLRRKIELLLRSLSSNFQPWKRLEIILFIYTYDSIQFENHINVFIFFIYIAIDNVVKHMPIKWYILCAVLDSSRFVGLAHERMRTTVQKFQISHMIQSKYYFFFNWK